MTEIDNALLGEKVSYARAQGMTGDITETITRDGDGRATKREISGLINDQPASFTYHYDYDGQGRLISYTDDQDASNDSTYKYDHAGRRVEMTVGDSVWRFVYDGDDVVAEFVDENGNGIIDRTRYYWLLPNIDQRIGFVDVVDTGQGTEYHYYYYLTDQVGSVIAVIDSQGNIVNQYDYDAFGNLNGQDSFETVENRYRFHGREYDSHRGEYYYRYRNYIPEWGQFASPDMILDATEPEGVCNYVFCGNDAIGFIDPMGLELEKIEEGSREFEHIIQAWLIVEEYGSRPARRYATRVLVLAYQGRVVLSGSPDSFADTWPLPRLVGLANHRVDPFGTDMGIHELDPVTLELRPVGTKRARKPELNSEDSEDWVRLVALASTLGDMIESCV